MNFNFREDIGLSTDNNSELMDEFQGYRNFILSNGVTVRQLQLKLFGNLLVFQKNMRGE